MDTTSTCSFQHLKQLAHFPESLAQRFPFPWKVRRRGQQLVSLINRGGRLGCFSHSPLDKNTPKMEEEMKKK